MPVPATRSAAISPNPPVGRSGWRAFRSCSVRSICRCLRTARVNVHKQPPHTAMNAPDMHAPAYLTPKRNRRRGRRQVCGPACAVILRRDVRRHSPFRSTLHPCSKHSFHKTRQITLTTHKKVRQCAPWTDPLLGLAGRRSCRGAAPRRLVGHGRSVRASRAEPAHDRAVRNAAWQLWAWAAPLFS
jgi:hypothetical protein